MRTVLRFMFLSGTIFLCWHLKRCALFTISMIVVTEVSQFVTDQRRIIIFKIVSSCSRWSLFAIRKYDYDTRSIYNPESVFMRTISPSVIKSGTFTVRPDVSVAGLVPPVAVSPFTPGTVSSTFISTVAGS